MLAQRLYSNRANALSAHRAAPRGSRELSCRLALVQAAAGSCPSRAGRRRAVAVRTSCSAPASRPPVASVVRVHVAHVLHPCNPTAIVTSWVSPFTALRCAFSARDADRRRVAHTTGRRCPLPSLLTLCTQYTHTHTHRRDNQIVNSIERRSPVPLKVRRQRQHHTHLAALPEDGCM